MCLFQPWFPQGICLGVRLLGHMVVLFLAFFIELEQKNSQFVWKHKRPHIAKAIMRKKNGAGGIRLPDFRLYYKVSHQNSMVLKQKASLMAQTVKSPPAVWETWVQTLGWEAPLEKEMATHSSTLAWRIPWTEEPGRL